MFNEHLPTDLPKLNYAQFLSYGHRGGSWRSGAEGVEEGGCGALRQDQGTAVRDMSPGAVVEPTLLCVRLSGPCCHVSQLRSDLTRPRPASFSLTACSGGKHARPPSPAGTTSLPGRAQVSPGPLRRTVSWGMAPLWFPGPRTWTCH